MSNPNAKVITVGVQKGGVGKTTTVVNLAYCLARTGLKILVVDLDPQGNCSMMLGKIHPEEQPRTVKNLFLNENSFFCNCKTKSKYKNIDIIPSTLDLFELSNELTNSPLAIIGLKNALDDGTLLEYDLILIDTPPNLGGLFITSALVVSNAYIMPIECESFFSLKGVDQFQKFAQQIKKSINPKLKFLGGLITMYDARTKASSLMVPRIIDFLGKENTFKTIIPRNSKLNRAVMKGKSICDADKRSTSCKAYQQLAEEIIPYIVS